MFHCFVSRIKGNLQINVFVTGEGGGGGGINLYPAADFQLTAEIMLNLFENMCPFICFTLRYFYSLHNYV